MKPNRFETIILAIIGVALAIAIYLSRTDETAFVEKFVVEDGAIEWITVLALAAGAIVMLRRCVRCKAKPWIFFRLALLGAGMVLIFGAGEEISWGQRIFDIETPEALKEANRQSEMNLHNLEFGDISVNKLFSKFLAIFIITYTIILPLLYRKYSGVADFLDRFAVPLPRPIHTIAWLVLIICTEAGPIASKKSGEMTEFGGSALFLLIILFPMNAFIYRKGKA